MTYQPQSIEETFSLRTIQGTPFPNRLLEAVIHLPEIEARLVCLIVRSTLGWQAGSPGERRASVLMTYGELRAAVGIASRAAIAAAIDGLVARGILEVLTSEGEVLRLEQRHRMHRPLRFRITRAWVETNR